MSASDGNSPGAFAVEGTAPTPPQLGESLRLNFNEDGFARFWPPVSMITFFRGDSDTVADHLRPRLAKVLRVNPWLMGRLIKCEGHLELLVPDAATFKKRCASSFCDITMNDLHPGLRVDEAVALVRYADQAGCRVHRGR